MTMKNKKDINQINQIVKHAMQGVMPKSISASDTDLITKLCVMASIPTGKEDHRELLRGMSDDTINLFISNLESVKKNPIGAPVAQFFLLEWCWRNDHFYADWKWEWDNVTEGHASYNSKEPFEKLAVLAMTTLSR